MADLGVEVTMIEVNEDILLTEIEEVRELLKDHLKNQSIRILTGAKISKVTTSKSDLIIMKMCHLILY